MMALPPLLTVSDIRERLQSIFPEGTANRNYVTREISAKTVFVMLYIGAVEGRELLAKARSGNSDDRFTIRVDSG